jgi:hypothetical protein
MAYSDMITYNNILEIIGSSAAEKTIAVLRAAFAAQNNISNIYSVFCFILVLSCLHGSSETITYGPRIHTVICSLFQSVICSSPFHIDIHSDIHIIFDDTEEWYVLQTLHYGVMMGL